MEALKKEKSGHDSLSQDSYILVVDDSKANLKILSECLKDQYKILVATSGEQCLDIINQGKIPDLVLLDIEMPGMSGYEVCQQLKNNKATESLPIIFITGKTGVDNEVKGLEYGAVDYITKPIHPKLVRARVNTHLTLKAQSDLLGKMALEDQLTGLYNRHHLIKIASHTIARANRHNEPVSLLVIDIDDFKQINDKHGHLAGDDVLKSVASLLKSNHRESDVVARYGGEEFVILMDVCPINKAKDKAEHIRRSIYQLKIHNLKVSVSIGVAELSKPNENFSELFERADVALYEAKQKGKNCVKAAS
ncbi:MAG: diguanylate cyclase [Gammaproteobacteria bacterium]|nr:diguanylate cyclase [Gammaproteobacteria bacterium]MDH5631010.1 diguanylate cyclase [Gammaproteobacteria bacterium]